MEGMKPKVFLGIVLVNLLCLIIILVIKPNFEVVINRPTPLRTIFIYKEELDDGRDIPPPPKVLGTKPSRLLYLVMTESCLPSDLRSDEVIGNPSICDCDVLVLSYRSVCSEASLPHVEYIFNSATTWGTGRNLLHEVAKRRNEKYLYYIFMDDDIILESTIKKNPWRMFEDFLKRVEPAIGGVDCTCFPFLQHGINARKMQGCDSTASVYFPAPRFDAALNGFHYQAVDYILPYTDKLDVHHWSLSALYANIKMEIFFAGQAVLHTQLYLHNPKHRPYTRNEFSSRLMVSATDIIELELPVKYRNSTVLSEWRKDKFTHERHSKTYCLPPPPPHTPIKPFAYSTRLQEASI